MLNKRFSINLVSTVLAFAINIGIGFLLTPFVVRHLGIEAYGFFGLANEFIGYAQILAIALNSMAARFITISIHQDAGEKTLQYFSSIFFADIIISIALFIPSILVIVFLKHLINISAALVPDVSLLWTFMFLSFFVSIIDTAFSVSTFAKNRLDLAALRKIESGLLRVFVLVGAFYFLSPKVWYLGLAALLTNVYILCTDIYYTRKLLPQMRVSRRFFNLLRIKEIVMSGVWNSFTRLSDIFARGLDLLITNLFISSAAMGSLSVSRLLPGQILALFAVIAGVFAPEFTILFAKGDKPAMLRQINGSIKLLGCFSCIPMAILFAYGDTFYSLWLPTQNARLRQILSILNCFAYVFALPLEGLWNIFTAMNKVKTTSLFLFANSIVSIVALLIALQFSNDMGTKLFIVAGLSTILSIIRALTFLPMYGAHCLGLKLTAFYPSIFKNAMAGIAATAFSFGVKTLLHGSSWGLLVLETSITGIVAFGFSFMLVPGREDRVRLLDKVKNKLRCIR